MLRPAALRRLLPALAPALAALLLLSAAPAAAQEVRRGSMAPDLTESVRTLPLGYIAKWENYSPDGRFFSETTYTLVERDKKEATWDVRHVVVADEEIAAVIRDAYAQGLIAVARDDADGIEIVTQTITDLRGRTIVKGTPFGYEYNEPHDCAFTFSLCRFTRTLPTGEVYHLVRWGELYDGLWSTRVNYDPWKDPAERRDELFTMQTSIADDGLRLDEIEVWGGEIIAILRRIEE